MTGTKNTATTKKHNTDDQHKKENNDDTSNDDEHHDDIIVDSNKIIDFLSKHFKDKQDIVTAIYFLTKQSEQGTLTMSFWPLRLVWSRTLAFHASNTGSNPVEVTEFFN